MNHHSHRLFRSSFLVTALAGLLLVGATGCVETDPEYAANLVTSGTAWKGDEIVGVWVSKQDFLVGSSRETMLVGPGGQGQFRDLNTGRGPLEGPLHWTYTGQGVWQASVKWNHLPATWKLAMRYNGNKLLVAVKAPIGEAHRVFVRAEDESAVEEHLKTR